MKHGNRPQRPLAGLRAAITGGTSGLGLALLNQFAEAGASVAFIARDAERVARTAQGVAGSHGFVGDVAKKDDIYPLATRSPDRSAGSTC